MLDFSSGHFSAFPHTGTLCLLQDKSCSESASSSGASIFAETKREQSEREARVTGDEREARGTTGRRRKASETPARKRVDFLAILSFSWHSHFSAFLSLESRQF